MNATYQEAKMVEQLKQNSHLPCPRANLEKGNDYEKRAVVAGLCEPKLLKDKAVAVHVINLLDEITATLTHDNKLTDEEDSLRKALGYGWSVAIVHAPAGGKKAFEKLLQKKSKHIK